MTNVPIKEAAHEALDSLNFYSQVLCQGVTMDIFSEGITQVSSSPLIQTLLGVSLYIIGLSEIQWSMVQDYLFTSARTKGPGLK